MSGASFIDLARMSNSAVFNHSAIVLRESGPGTVTIWKSIQMTRNIDNKIEGQYNPHTLTYCAVGNSLLYSV